jgi:hypothetical protein
MQRERSNIRTAAAAEARREFHFSSSKEMEG